MQRNKLILLALVMIAGAFVLAGFLFLNNRTDPETVSENNSQNNTDQSTSNSSVPLVLPGDVLSEQVYSQYTLRNVIYGLAVEPNSNYNMPILAGKDLDWHGVLRSQDEGQTWSKFFSIIDPADPEIPTQQIKYNPVGVFFENNKLYIDIANDRGAGSGEGQLVRFSNGGLDGTWIQEGCFYFVPENYYLNYPQEHLAFDPHKLSASTDCIY